MSSKFDFVFEKKKPEYRHILFILFFVFLFAEILQAQRTSYTINVTLDTSTHSLQGEEKMVFTNNSEKSLQAIPVHLWANAHQERTSALARQKLHQGDLSLYRAASEDRGGFSIINFSSEQQQISFTPDPLHIDIGWLSLSQPLLRGQTITISCVFTLDIPKSFSRLGRTGHSYQLTQWYPVIPVLDDEGWHTMPNLDQGEYFNAFADFEITVTVPENYIMAATGTQISNLKAGGKTRYVYEAKNVIDFAFFLSPAFIHKTKTIELENNSHVQLNIYTEPFLNADWDSAMIYAERAIRFYSDWLGTYPYEQMSVVHTPFSRAGYMEYPMLAQISYTNNAQLLDRVITHEIGHTWIYAILANNQREHPWLDEGLNSFIEHEYMDLYYSDPEEIIFPDIIHSPSSMSDYDALQHIVRSAGDLEPPASRPELQQNDQYIYSAYVLPSQGLQLIKMKLGETMMKQMFRNYYSKHKFSNVTPEDLRSSFEETCQCNLSWFFEEWLTHAHNIDYRFAKVDFKNDSVSIENRSGVNIPVTVSEYADNELIGFHWLEGFSEKASVQLNDKTDEVRLYDNLMGINKKWHSNIYPRHILPSLSLVPKVGHYDRPNLSITPIVGYNLTDGGLAGLAFITDLFPQSKVKLLAMPLYGIESKKLRFFGEARYIDDIDFAGADKFLLGINSSAFGYHLDTFDNTRDHYTRFSPFIGVRLESQSYSHVSKWIKYRYMNVTRTFNADEQSRYDVHELSFQISSDTVLKPFNATWYVQSGNGFVRTHIHYNQHFRGRDKLRGFWIHGFAGWLPVYNNPVAEVRFGLNGKSSLEHLSKDYMYDHWLLGRNATDGNISRQLFFRDADLKTLADLEENSNWMLGGGFSVSMPLKFIHVYADAGFYNSAITNKPKVSYSSGFSIILMKDAFEIYLPVLESTDIRESVTYDFRDRFLDRISFRANFHLANPLNLMDHYQYRY